MDLKYPELENGHRNIYYADKVDRIIEVSEEEADHDHLALEEGILQE
jgi:hypothetical protein